MALQDFVVFPIRGMKSAYPADDPSLYVPVGEGAAESHSVEEKNNEYQSIKRCCSKAPGDGLWSNSAIGSATGCQVLFELDDGTNIDHLVADHGKLYYYDGSRDPQDLCTAGLTFNTSLAELWSIIKYGSYAVISDFGNTELYKWKNGDANCSKIHSTDAPKFRFLENFQRRIIGAYDETAGASNGQISFKWSDDLADLSSDVDFAAADQLYVPNDDPIVGIKRIGINGCLIYSKNSIHRIDYVPDYTKPFQVFTQVPDQSFQNHHSIVAIGNMHYGFNRNYGFCRYNGGPVFPYGEPISEDISNWITGIDSSRYDNIQGVYVPHLNEIAWTVSLSGYLKNYNVLFYNIFTGNWRIEDKVSSYIDVWTPDASVSWNTLINNYSISTWGDMNSWASNATSSQRFVFMDDDGELYYRGTTDSTSNSNFHQSYRIEPMLSFGGGHRRSQLEEIWLGIVEGGNFNMRLDYRGGQTVKETNEQSWSGPYYISTNNPTNAKLNSIVKNNKYHQLKIGSRNIAEPYAFNRIIYRYSQGERY